MEPDSNEPNDVEHAEHRIRECLLDPSETVGRTQSSLHTYELVAIWFHLTHGFWSAMQTLGWSGKTWLCRWKVIGGIYVTLLMLGFLVVVLAFAFGCAPSLCDSCNGAMDCCKEAAAAACCQ